MVFCITYVYRESALQVHKNSINDHNSNIINYWLKAKESVPRRILLHKISFMGITAHKLMLIRYPTTLVWEDAKCDSDITPYGQKPADTFHVRQFMKCLQKCLKNSSESLEMSKTFFTWYFSKKVLLQMGNQL